MQKSLKCKIKLGLNVKLGKGQMQNYILAKKKNSAMGVTRTYAIRFQVQSAHFFSIIYKSTISIK